MWWWEFNKEEPLQEDLVVYEKFQEMRDERQRMTDERERQKSEAKRKGKQASGSKYSIADPTI